MSEPPTDADLRRVILGCEDRCQDAHMHDHFMAGGGFRWCLPRFAVTRPADTKTRVVLNTYPHNLIGVGVVMFGRGWGVRWKRSRR